MNVVHWGRAARLVGASAGGGQRLSVSALKSRRGHSGLGRVLHSHIGIRLVHDIVAGVNVLIFALRHLAYTDALTIAAFVENRSHSMTYAIFRTEGALAHKILSHLHATNAVVVVFTAVECVGDSK